VALLKYFKSLINLVSFLAFPFISVSAFLSVHLTLTPAAAAAGRGAPRAIRGQLYDHGTRPLREDYLPDGMIDPRAGEAAARGGDSPCRCGPWAGLRHASDRQLRDGGVPVGFMP
jgi:hypothetical protein